MAVKKISDFYGVGRISFFNGEQLKLRYELGNESLNFCVIDHIEEKGSNKKDELKDKQLYRYICSKKAQLDRYQLLSAKQNIMKQRIYALLTKLKENNSPYYKIIFDSYNKRFINNKYRLKKGVNNEI